MRSLLIFLSFFIYSISIFAKPLDLEISASNAILINADNNRVLFEKKAHQKAYPASVTKMITIYYVLENHFKDLNKYLVASENALKVISPETKIYSNYKIAPYLLESDGSSFEVQKDEKLTLNDLLHGMIICSGNDASNVVAENLGGSIENFMKSLNAFLKQKGCLDTNLINPHGLHMPDHVTSVYDVAYIMRLALNNPKFYEIFSCKFYLRPKTNKQQKKELITFNKLLKPGKNYYKYALCGKTGYHSKAKYNLLSVAKKNNRTLIAVVFGCPNNENRYEDTIKLFETAFAEKKIIKKVMDKEKIFLAKIKGGSKNLKATMIEDLIVEYYPSEEGEMKAVIFWDDIKAPITKGQKVATIQLVTDQNEILKKQNLYAAQDVKRTYLTTLKELFVKR
jgi:serine-type D-Ala-D-Ala carboxypeptidase (penicillin-binding protein 5/6)